MFDKIREPFGRLKVGVVGFLGVPLEVGLDLTETLPGGLREDPEEDHGAEEGEKGEYPKVGVDPEIVFHDLVLLQVDKGGEGRGYAGHRPAQPPGVGGEELGLDGLEYGAQAEAADDAIARHTQVHGPHVAGHVETGVLFEVIVEPYQGVEDEGARGGEASSRPNRQRRRRRKW